jgi:HPt (histidine-containing phosphotransfer) domain-containing protein
MADVVYINEEDGIKRVMNNTKLYAKLLAKFMDDPNLSEIDSALAAGDMAKAQSHTHTLKGLAANLSLTELFNQSLQLETQIKAGSVNPEQLALLKSVNTQTLTEVERVIAKYA